MSEKLLEYVFLGWDLNIHMDRKKKGKHKEEAMRNKSYKPLDMSQLTERAMPFLLIVLKVDLCLNKGYPTFK